MVNILGFLYYCQYGVFALIKRVGEKDENLASLLYSLLLSTNTIVFLFPLKFTIPKGALNPFPYNILKKAIFIAIFFVWCFLCKHYFLKKENYDSIITLYEKKFLGKKKQISQIGITYFLLSLLTFIFGRVAQQSVNSPKASNCIFFIRKQFCKRGWFYDL